MFKFQYQNRKKTKKWVTIFWATKWGNKGITGLQIQAAFGVLN